ncbi:MAG TPA: cytochrome b5-like heme/steroid binding domain-containing protein [Arachnia sp.]|nr:cytochrome b5-like heme/steroid binding domain-containing protein [Arachnia sp.]HMT85739.1 cytochrome b5-like heme/steroid binding domain-containing protein [Arachnia sp.]
MFDQILGLPLHPLVVHAVVVLLPLGALGLLALLVWRKARPVGLPLTVAVLVVATGAAWVARFSGTALAARVGEPELHKALGTQLPLVATLSLAVGALWWFLHRKGADPLWVRALAAIVALASLGLTAVVGHTGAQAVWGSVIAPTSTTEPAPTTPETEPAEETTSTPETPETPESSASSDAPPADGYTVDQVAEHDSAEDCWTIIDGTVYDLTDWVNQHPGGSHRIVPLCGTDGTSAFQGQHSGDSTPQDRLAQFELGPLVS